MNTEATVCLGLFVALALWVLWKHSRPQPPVMYHYDDVLRQFWRMAGSHKNEDPALTRIRNNVPKLLAQAQHAILQQSGPTVMWDRAKAGEDRTVIHIVRKV